MLMIICNYNNNNDNKTKLLAINDGEHQVCRF